MAIIRPSADLRNRYKEISELCKTTGQPVYITVNGREDTAIVDSKIIDELYQTIKLMQEINQGIADVNAGRIMSLEDAKKEIAMTYKIIITNSAFSDLESIKSFIAADNQEISTKYISKIFDRLKQLELFPYTGIKIANSFFDYAKAYYLICASHVAIYQVNELAKCIYVLRVLSHFQDWRDIVNKDILQNDSVLIENDNLQIVKMNKSMYFDIYQNSLDEDNRKYVPDEVFDSLEEASEVVNHIISAYDSEDGPFVYSVIRKKDNTNLGYVQLVKLEEGWEIGYHIAKIFTGNDYATEAVNLFIKYIQNNANVKQILGIALAANKASRRVLEKCGFELIYEGDGLYQGSKRKIIKAIKHL